jgi:tol-pal system protein YbgF
LTLICDKGDFSVRKIPFYLLLLTSLTACAGNDFIVQRQSSMEGRLEQVMQAQNAARSDIASLTAQLLELKEHNAKLAASAQELQTANEALQERVKTLTRRLEQLEPTVRQAATIELVNQETVVEGREESVQAAYMKAFGLYSASSYAAAAEAFNAFIASYPESEYAANARYWLGECYFTEKLYKEAIDSFTKLLDMKPSAKRSSEALLRIGQAWYKLKEPAKGSAVFKSLLDSYPGSDAALQAREQLDKK